MTFRTNLLVKICRKVFVVGGIFLYIHCSAAIACKLKPESEWYWSDARLILETEMIFLGKAVSYEKEKYEFEVKKVLRKPVKGWFVIRGDRVPLENFAPPEFNTQWEHTVHRGRAIHTKDCRPYTGFKIGGTYLVFLNRLHPMAYEEVMDPRTDKWYQTVIGTIPNPPMSKIVAQVGRKSLPLDRYSTEEVLDSILELVETSSVDTTAQHSVKKKWQASVKTGHFLHVKFAFQKVLWTGARKFSADEILVPFSSSGYIDHVLLHHDDSYVSLAKFHHRPHARLMCLPPLELANHSPFNKTFSREQCTFLLKVP